MSGAWETRTNVLVAILHVDMTTTAWSVGLRRLQWPGAWQDPMLLTGMPFDHARNSACEQMLSLGASHLFFLDSDVICPRDGVLKLLRHNVPLISGLYMRRSPPNSVPVAITGGRWVTEAKPNSGIHRVDFVGSGCMLIRRDLLKAMKPQAPGHHWFHWRVDEKGTRPPYECLSEDFTFCQAIKRQMNVDTLVDTSVVCRHIGLAQAGYGTFTPLNHMEAI